MSVKGFKVTDSERKVRVGIAAKNFDDLKKKTVDKFKLKLPAGQLAFQTPDGTLIETNDYFQTLEAQTLLIWVKKGERAETDAEILYKTIKEVNEEYLTAGAKVQEFFTEKMKNKVFKLAEVLKGIDSNKTKASRKDEHPEWFEGIDSKSKTKEEYMFRRSQDRIRTYYYKTKEALQHNNLPQAKLHYLLIELRDKLKNVNFYGCYFDRNFLIGDTNLKCICDGDGTFTCQGRWDKKNCLYGTNHRINPYASREERIIFQTWNLDHAAERKRSIIPAICDALKEDDEITRGSKVVNCKKAPMIDVDGIFCDLFTLDNLKFVHIVCHDKGAHSAKKAGPYLI